MDSNHRPPRPERGALANCATPRDKKLCKGRNCFLFVKDYLLFTFFNSLIASMGLEWLNTALPATKILAPD